MTHGKVRSGNTLFIDANNLISGAKIRFPFIPPEFSSIKIAVSPKSLSPEIAVSPELFYFPCNDNAYFIQKIQGDCYQQQRHITTCTEHLFSFSQRAGDTKRNSSYTIYGDAPSSPRYWAVVMWVMNWLDKSVAIKSTENGSK